MDPAVQAFVDKWAAKSAAKQEAIVALGAAKKAEWDADQVLTDRPGGEALRQGFLDEAERQWAIVVAQGVNGEEGRLYREAFEIAEAYVAANPEKFVSFGSFDVEAITKLVGLLGKNGRTEQAAQLTMYELVSFERQHIGQGIATVKRRTNGKAGA